MIKIRYTDSNKDSYNLDIKLKPDIKVKDKQDVKKGNVLFTTLEKGKYYVLYKIKDQNKVIRFQPIIVGIEQKGLDVPDDYINKFLKKHGYLSEE